MDVSFPAPVFSASGPYATVCADVTHTTENADTELEPRVRALAGRLEDQGAPAGVATIEEGGRAAGADHEVVDRRAAELVAEHEAHEEADAVEEIRSAAAHGLAVTGTASVVEALRKGAVETLVRADRPDDEELLVGSSPLLPGTGQGDMEALGVQEVHSVPADRALVGAAVASDAGVVVVPRSAMPGDIPVAAILATPTTPPRRPSEEPPDVRSAPARHVPRHVDR